MIQHWVHEIKANSQVTADILVAGLSIRILILSKDYFQDQV
jgi:hypothetical protein